MCCIMRQCFSVSTSYGSWLGCHITLGDVTLLLGICPLDGLGCPGVTKVVVDLRKFVLSSHLWGFASEELN
jgi:hypothetical protein